MKQLLTVFFLFALILSPDILSAQTWQTAVTDGTKLGVRDKYGELESYEATFVVWIMDKVKFTANPINVEGDAWGEVYWPFDFEDGAGQKLETFPPGYFKVEISVKGEIVARTDFKMTLEEFEKSVEVYKAQKFKGDQ
ncbi:MAG: hypothetical protein AAF502_09235 [Bacteroidota bacterium]